MEIRCDTGNNFIFKFAEEQDSPTKRLAKAAKTKYEDSDKIIKQFLSTDFERRPAIVHKALRTFGYYNEEQVYESEQNETSNGKIFCGGLTTMLLTDAIIKYDENKNSLKEVLEIVPMNEMEEVEISALKLYKLIVED